MMNASPKHFQEIVDLLLKLPNGFNARILEYSDVRCKDASIPLHLIHSFLVDAHEDPLSEKDLSAFREMPEFQALVDVVAGSVLGNVLTVDSSTALLKFRDDFGHDDRFALAMYLLSRTGAVGQGGN